MITRQAALLRSRIPRIQQTVLIRSHTRDSYNKETDNTPPADDKIHRVDGMSENAQKPYEAPSGKYAEIGAKTQQAFQHARKDEPYKAPGEDRRYGGKEEYAKDKGPEVSKPDEGPEGKSKHGLKP
ncbi:hypothetical protein VNI00_000892 [Paramarasmius palmivorus]|uniref:Uncharacterized protein n=1 Tax=Paramarasmius palmivorus TaxID=297713 RepID=A0AAW0E4U0_9AGAR